MHNVTRARETYEQPLWRLAASTIVRTLLAFTLPYLIAYYCVIGAWQGIRALLALLGALPR